MKTLKCKQAKKPQKLSIIRKMLNFTTATLETRILQMFQNFEEKMISNLDFYTQKNYPSNKIVADT